MRAVCVFFAFVFGATGVSCFYNLFKGGEKNSPTTLFLLGIFSLAIFALCLFGLIKLSDRAKEKGTGIIVKTKIVDTFGKKSTAGVAARGVVGDVVAGPVGALVGASTAKDKRSTTFLITYKDGKKLTRTVQNNSAEYRKYIKYLDD